MRYSSVLSLFALIFLIVSCSDDNSTNSNNETEDITFSEINQTVFQTSCAFSGCHGNDTRRAGLNLSPDSAYVNLVNVISTQNPSLKRVDPGNSTNSYLMKKLNGDGTSQMPLNGAPLSQEKRDMIAEWIDNGAENN